MSETTRRAMLTGTAAAGLTRFVRPAQAADYPAYPIELIIPDTAGGGQDVVGRLLVQYLPPVLGGTMVAVNKAGAGATLGVDYVHHAKPDGTTLVLAGMSSLAAAPSIFANLPYDPLKDFTHISLFGEVAYFLSVNPGFATDIKELIAKAKAAPGKYSYAAPVWGRACIWPACCSARWPASR
jgi:tripartite-type tricarboxylate transporter receptor subunit TctC